MLILSMYWRGLTTRGAVAGGVTGLVSAVTLVFLSKSVWVNVLGNKAPLFPWDQPALFPMPAAFLAAFVFSKLDASAREDGGGGVRGPVRPRADRLRLGGGGEALAGC